jgi:hypothetical protein
MMSTITNQGKVRWMIYTGRMTAALFIVFLTCLPRRAERKIFLSRASFGAVATVWGWV